ncbi:tonB-system energizer ExbB [Bradyrhizobium sp. dw_78]|uniref:tonB-system energizer ExbB n=1 Tax=Bradyrhizobium sp. dw_78 TaxID=2719793 RepID=UPI0023EF40D6|nr:tonB-system energizer ExbB [Bradyrhizobium sp. dw_78]
MHSMNIASIVDMSGRRNSLTTCGKMMRKVSGLIFVMLLATPVAAQDNAPVSGPAVMSQGTVASPMPATAAAAPAVENSGENAGAGSAPAGQLPVAVSSSSAVTASLPQDLSPWSMFKNADIIVKIVMVGLAFASLATWTVWLAKGLELIAAKRRARSAARKLQRAESLEQARIEIEAGWTRQGPVADLVQAAVRETRRSTDLSIEGIKERLAIALSRIEARAGRGMARGTGLLATIGATAPFVGLFGTVWGIMNSFIGISQSKTTNLAVVAPGIAEALLATAIGLVAAIPAVIIYNVFARAITGYRALLSDASGEVLQHLSRDLERQALSAALSSPVASGPAVGQPERSAARAASHLRPAE